jgi:phosphonate transport system substrate-binding protein
MRLVPALLLLVLLAPAGCGGPDTQAPVLRFSAIPDEDVTGFVQKFQPVAAYLAERLGVPVEYQHSESYAASVETFNRGEILLAWFGGLTGVQARHLVPGAHAIAQGVEDPAYYSYFIANADTGLERADAFPQAARGLTLAFGSESSTSGRLMPEHFIRESTGQGPREFFGNVVFSGNHDKTVEWVESGQAQIGAVSYKVYDARIAAGKSDPDVVKVIWKTPVYADYNFTAHPDLEKTFGEGFTKKLQQALLEMRDENLLAAFKRSAFVPAQDADFAAIGQVAEALGFLD